MKILLIAGGWSSEREISLRGAEGIRNALLQRGHLVTFFDLRDSFDTLIETAKEHDFAFIILHGQPGEDGLVQAMLDKAGCPYQGSGPAGSFLALHKASAKQIFRSLNLPTANWEFLPVVPDKQWKPSLPYPIFAKSNTGGSSLHLGKATNKAELDNLIAEIFAAGDCVLLEEALDGREVTCGVLGGMPLPPVLIEPVMGAYFDYESKYQSGGAREICPAPIDAPLTARIQELALACHNGLGLRGISRTDFILGADNSLHILEVNTIPGMTTASLVPKEAKALGLEFGDLLERLIALGMGMES